MFPVVATGAPNPDLGLTAAALAIGYPPSSDHPTPVPKPYGAEALARQILDAVARCRALGHRDPSITLTRPTAVVEGVHMLLLQAGLQPEMKPAAVGGCSVITVRG
ncbi:hypothetical protein [Oleisolibacter albus]|uniref:hypothetical protein n=1 Tax=Oleisolibacter albus TaxID=2171757 RepID=UPI000DF3141C|nr:hypothetical protein [Oleisolibacter albus]